MILAPVAELVDATDFEAIRLEIAYRTLKCDGANPKASHKNPFPSGVPVRVWPGAPNPIRAIDKYSRHRLWSGYMISMSDYMTLTKDVRQRHLDLSEPCVIRGTTSTHCRGILSYFLNTELNGRGVDCCHACHNEACSNPHHMYWGTRSENVKDALSIDPSSYSNGAYGDRNGQYGVKPWRNNAVRVHPQMVEVWKNCSRIYEDYYLKDWPFSTYGNGATYFRNKYGYSEATIIKMWKMFPSWNPLVDDDYLKWIQEL